MNTQNILSAHNLVVAKGKKEILNIPEFSVIRGEFVAVTGPNGAGKSTLLQALSLLENGARGDIVFLGNRVLTSGERLAARRRMAMVFQEPLLLRGKVRENVATGLRFRKIAKKIWPEKVWYWLTKLKVDHLAERDVRTLSGGEARRVSLARAMILEPDIIFLDEPFTYLDAPSKGALLGELKELFAETGTTALMVTHDLFDIPYLADRMIVMTDGRIRQSGKPYDLLNHPCSVEIADFVGMSNIWPAKAHTDRNGFICVNQGEGVPLLTLEHGELSGELSPGSALIACVRPEHIVVYSAGAAGETVKKPDHNVFRGRVCEVNPHGYYYKLLVQAGIDITVMAEAARFTVAPRPGDFVELYVSPEKVHIIVEN